MTKVLTDSSNYTAIASAIRTKLGVQTTYKPSDMADAIAGITDGSASAPELAASTQANILVLAHRGNFDGTTDWDGLTISSLEQAAPNYGCIYFTQSGYATYVLSAANSSFTAYIVCNAINPNSQYGRIVTAQNAASNGNEPNINLHNGKAYISIYGSDYDTGIYGQEQHVYAVSVDASAKLADFYIDGVSVKSDFSFNNSGQTVSFGATHTGSDGVSLIVYAIAIVSGAEDSTTVIANQQALMDFFGIDSQ